MYLFTIHITFHTSFSHFFSRFFPKLLTISAFVPTIFNLGLSISFERLTGLDDSVKTGEASKRGGTSKRGRGGGGGEGE